MIKEQSYKRHAPFHESYFNHPCSVVVEADVLQTDIRGGGCCAGFRRWFHSLFLLSYFDERCVIYYVSSQALRLERARHFRRFRGRIHPLSKFSNLWTIAIFIAIVTNRILFHYHMGLLFGKQAVFSLTIGVMTEALLLTDVIVNFMTGYTDKVARKVVLDFPKGCTLYASSKLFLHAGSAIPLQLILTLRYGLKNCTLCKINKFVCVLKLLGIFGLCRLYDASSFLSRDRSSFSKMIFYKIVRILLLACLTVLQVLDLMETIILVFMIYFHRIHRESYLMLLIDSKITFKNKSDIFFFCIEFSRVSKFIVLYGYSLFRNDYYLDKISALTCHLISCVFCVWALKVSFAIIQKLKYTNDERLAFFNRTQMWLRSYQVSDTLSRRVSEYYSKNPYFSRAIVVENNNDLYKCLPLVLTKEIKLSCSLKYFSRVPYFAEWSIDVVESLVTSLTEEIFLENDLVSHPFTPGDGLMIIYSGVLAVYSVIEKELGHLIDGDYFGELSLVTDEEVRTSSVVAVTACKVLLLHKKVFRNVVRDCPKLFYDLRKLLIQKYEQSQRGRSGLNITGSANSSL